MGSLCRITSDSGKYGSSTRFSADRLGPVESDCFKGRLPRVSRRQPQPRAIGGPPTPEPRRSTCRSLELRPKGRSELNDQRKAGRRGGRSERTQLGHAHVQANHARGACRADELAAAEAFEKKVGQVTQKETNTIAKYRRELRAVLDELNPDIRG